MKLKWGGEITLYIYIYIYKCVCVCVSWLCPMKSLSPKRRPTNHDCPWLSRFQWWTVYRHGPNINSASGFNVLSCFQFCTTMLPLTLLGYGLNNSQVKLPWLSIQSIPSQQRCLIRASWREEILYHSLTTEFKMNCYQQTWRMQYKQLMNKKTLKST